MKNRFGILTLTLLMVAALTGCTGMLPSLTEAPAATTAVPGATDTATAQPGTSSGAGSSLPITNTGIVTGSVNDADTDSSWDAAQSTLITLNGTTAAVTGGGASVSGGVVTINAEGTYVVSGTLNGGQILIDAPDKALVRLVLNGAHITAGDSAAIYAAAADKCVIILAEGTENTIADNASYTYADAEKEEPNAALFSKCDLSINGTGSMTVSGNFNHGIATKDDLVIASGNITVNAVNAALRGKDSVTILDGVFSLTTTEGDGIKTDDNTDKGWILINGGTFTINAYNDAVQAYTMLEINGGTFDITAGGGWPGGSLKTGSHDMSRSGTATASNDATGSYKGLKSSGALVINNGVFTVSAYDDAMHSNADITINGGTFTLQSGDDGIHADGTVTIAGGTVGVKNSFEGIEGSNITLSSGNISVYSTDDGFNVNSSSGLLTISGGNIYINANGDGLDSNCNAVMTGGTVYVDGPTTSGNGALDYERQFEISGGTLVAVDSGGMSATPSTSSQQPSLIVYYTGVQAVGTELSLKSADGATLVSYTPQKEYRTAVITAEGMTQGAAYSLYSNGQKLCDVTLSAAVTGIDNTGAAVSGGMGMPGGGGGGQRMPGGGGGGGSRR